MENNIEKFICDDCKKELPITERADADLDVCKECLGNYENVTGWCSAYCRITGRCDNSC